MENIEKISKLGLRKHVEMLGNLAYTDSLTIIHNSSMLLFIEYTDSMTTKIYDYISSGNPILAITQNIEVIKFIKKYSPHSKIIEKYDMEIAANTIHQLYTEWKIGKRYEFSLRREYFRRYSRNSLAKKVVEIINSL